MVMVGMRMGEAAGLAMSRVRFDEDAGSWPASDAPAASAVTANQRWSMDFILTGWRTGDTFGHRR